MTGKRFIFHGTEIEDTLETDVDYKYTSCNKDGFQDLCEMLNELAEENEQLKSEINSQILVIKGYQERNEELFEELKELKQKINSVFESNDAEH